MGYKVFENKNLKSLKEINEEEAGIVFDKLETVYGD